MRLLARESGWSRHLNNFKQRPERRRRSSTNLSACTLMKPASTMMLTLRDTLECLIVCLISSSRGLRGTDYLYIANMPLKRGTLIHKQKRIGELRVVGYEIPYDQQYKLCQISSSSASDSLLAFAEEVISCFE